MKTVDAIREAITELDELARVEEDTFRYNRLLLILQELEKAEKMIADVNEWNLT
jgi:hypothetical protein